MSLLFWHGQIEMEENNAVYGLQEAGPRGVAAFAGAVQGGVTPGGDPRIVVASGGPRGVAATYSATGGPSGYVVSGPSRVIASAYGRPNGHAAVVRAGGDPSGIVGNSRRTMERNNVRLENSHLRKEV